MSAELEIAMFPIQNPGSHISNKSKSTVNIRSLCSHRENLHNGFHCIQEWSHSHNKQTFLCSSARKWDYVYVWIIQYVLLFFQVDVGHIDLEPEENKIDQIVKLVKTTGKLTVEEG